MTMRQIKFRGKSLKNKKWVYGDLMRNICATRIVRYKETDNESVQRADWDYIEVDDSTVGQFTGLTDCNGKEIYEGDIVKDEIDAVYEICWYDDLASFIAEMVCNEKPFMITDIGTKNITLIGNIHDNPELITNQPTGV